MNTTANPNGRVQTEFSEEEVAERLGISIHSLRLHSAAGVLGPSPYQQFAQSLAEVGQFFGVSERTVGTWRAKGMPGEPGCYPLATIGYWRAKNLESRNTAQSPRSGLLARAIYRLLSIELGRKSHAAASEAVERVFPELSDEEKEKVRYEFLGSLHGHFQEFMPDEKEIDRILAECQNLL